jgi:hypothetical protein
VEFGHELSFCAGSVLRGENVNGVRIPQDLPDAYSPAFKYAPIYGVTSFAFAFVCRPKLHSKIGGFRGGDYEECRLLRYKTQFVLHRRHITSPLQSPAG